MTFYKGDKHNEATKKKIGDKNRGKKRPWTKEWRDKIKKSKVGFKHSELTKTKMSESGLKKDLSAFYDFIKGRDQSGDKNPNWMGGLSKNEYAIEFNKELKEIVKHRDMRVCQLCNNEPKERLSVHHIDYNKKNSNKKNLISLCGSCHMKANYNREYWTRYFNDIQSFNYILKDIFETRKRKSLDYGNSFRIFGIEGINFQIASKIARLWNLQSSENGIQNESLRDTLKDLAVYSLMAAELYTSGNLEPDEKEMGKLLRKRFTGIKYKI